MNERSIALDEELVRTKAYEIWQSRGGGYGDPNSDWFQAQSMLEAERSRLPEAERSHSKALVEPSKTKRSQTMNPYNTFAQFSDLQRATLENWADTIPNLRSFNLSDYRKNFEKALQFQKALTLNSLELQAQLTRMYVETQKQFWEEYYNTLLRWW